MKRINYNKSNRHKTLIHVNDSYEAKSIEEQILIASTGGQNMKAEGSLIFTERKDGVAPQYNIRTDRFDLALEQTEKYDKMTAAQRDDKPSEESTEQEKTE